MQLRHVFLWKPFLLTWSTSSAIGSTHWLERMPMRRLDCMSSKVNSGGHELTRKLRNMRKRQARMAPGKPVPPPSNMMSCKVCRLHCPGTHRRRNFGTPVRNAQPPPTDLFVIHAAERAAKRGTLRVSPVFRDPALRPLRFQTRALGIREL